MVSVLPIRPALRHALLVEASEKVAIKRPKPKTSRKKYPDEMILAIRRMSEWEGKSLAAICRAFPDVAPGYVRNLIAYMVRAELDPGPRPVRGAGA